MPWSTAQQKRLGAEKGLLESYFRNRVTWIDPGDQTKVEVRVTCSNDKQYTLRVYLPSDFPNSCPYMVVKTSSKLRARNGLLLEQYPGDNHLGRTIDGYTGICHFRPNFWKGDNTLYQVFMKGLIWLEAYEAHLRTGQPLSQYLTEMIRQDQTGHEMFKKIPHFWEIEKIPHFWEIEEALSESDTKKR